MKEACEKDIFRGVTVGRDNICLSHLQYADDTIIFGKWDFNNLKTLINLLKCWQEVSGLKINWKKSRLFGVGVNPETIKRYADRMGCRVGDSGFSYLGMPINSNMKRKVSWATIVDKFDVKLASWKKKTIPSGGRLTLIKSVLSGLPLYFFSIFRAPVCILNLLEKLRKTFFGEGISQTKKFLG